MRVVNPETQLGGLTLLTLCDFCWVDPSLVWLSAFRLHLQRLSHLFHRLGAAWLHVEKSTGPPVMALLWPGG